MNQQPLPQATERDRTVCNQSTADREPECLPLETSLALALEVLETGDFQSRWEAMKLLPGFGPNAIAPLIALVEAEAALDAEETDWELLWFAARILGQFQHADAIAALVTLVQTGEREDIAGIAATALASIGPGAIPHLMELLETRATRPLAIQALAQINSPATVDCLLTATDDADEKVRATAIDALSRFRDPRIVSVLLQALQDSFAPVRRAAVSSLGARAKPLVELGVALEARLQPCLYDVNAAVTRQAAIALGRVGTAMAVSALVERLQQPAPLSLQIDLVRALQRSGSEAALDAIAQQLQATLATGPETGPATDPATDPDNQATAALQQEIVAGLGRIEAPTAKPRAAAIAQQCLTSPDRDRLSVPVKQSLALSLGQLGQTQTIDALIPLLADPVGGVRLHAIAALKQLDGHQHLIDWQPQASENPALADGIAEALAEWQS